ncbi:MAG: helix-turn-helix domain-containing protein [Victivallales bacterium]|jgi:transcriptional regulator with XRE-family HTH domain|nr:helix-turn-helix domain-containing protein [Victivallales bacterium]
MPVTPLKLKFGKLIRDYLRNAEIYQNELADRMQVSGSAVSQMLHGKIILHQHHLKLICELLQLDRTRAFELQSMLAAIRTGEENLRSPFNDTMFSLRCERGLTLQQLSNLSGIPVAHLQVFENSFEAIPTLDEASKLAPILGCTPASLLQSAGVGGLSRQAIDQLTASGEAADNEVREALAAYHTERQVPLLDLFDLEAFDGDSINDFAKRANKVFELGDRDVPDDSVAIRASGRDLALGLPGTILMLVAKKRPLGYREFDLCWTNDQKFLLQELRQSKIKEFKMAGTRRPRKAEIVWRLPVLEMTIRPTKPDYSLVKR